MEQKIKCLNCGAIHDRDENAAKHRILIYLQELLEFGRFLESAYLGVCYLGHLGFHAL